MDRSGGVRNDDYWSETRKFDDMFANMDEDVWEDPAQVLDSYLHGSIESEISSGSRGVADVRTSSFVGARPVSSEPNQEKVAHLMAQLKLVNRKYQDRFAPMPTETVRLIMMGRPYSLECYKSYADKTSLLDEALYNGDGNAILAAVLHLKKTVKRTLLVRALTPRPVAAQHLINHMKLRAENTEVLQLLAVLNRKEEACLWQYKLALNQETPEQRVKALRTVLKDPYVTEAESPLIYEHLNLLERQLPVDAADKRGNVKSVDRSKPDFELVGSSLQSTVYYCAYFHWGVGENHLACPAMFKKLFQMSEKQYHWPILKALTDRQQWVTILETFVVKKTLLRGPRLRGEIPVKQVLAVLRKAGAPETLVAAIQGAGA